MGEPRRSDSVLLNDLVFNEISGDSDPVGSAAFIEVGRSSNIITKKIQHHSRRKNPIAQRGMVCYNVAMQYILWIVSPYSHSECFREVAECLQSALIEFGHICEITTVPPTIRDNVIIIGAHLLHPSDILYLKSPIVWQLEQMPDESDWERSRTPWTATYIEILKRAEVWDYSLVNISTLAKLGIEAKLLEVGYTPTLTRVKDLEYPDIDVLFLGSMNKRRAEVLRGIQASGANVIHAFDCYGVKRDALVSRAKVVINVHFYNAKIWEIVRCSYMMANRKCVVSEIGLDKELEGPFYDGIAFTDYDRLVSRCVDLLDDDNARFELAKKGFDIFTKKSQVEYLRKVLQ